MKRGNHQVTDQGWPAPAVTWILGLGLMGAVVTSKYIGDFAFEIYQDLSQNLSIAILKKTQEKPDTPPATVPDGRPFDRQPKSEEIIVAVIDTGIDLEQTQLKGRLWTNPGETGLDQKGHDKASNGLDDDRNGFVDDVHGWNFAADSSDIDDQHGHGTHIAGIIAAEKKDEVQGIAPQARIMSLKYYDPKTPGLDNLRNSTRALRYAVRMGARIINYSGGGTEPNAEELQILRKANEKGILLVAAAGNEKSNSDNRPFYPAGYRLSNILSVAAVDSNSLMLPSSNYGRKSVDVAAPGLKILSTLPGGKLGYMTGTSQATAYVSGTAAQILSLRRGHPKMSPNQLKRQILQTVARTAALREKTISGGRVELSRTLTMRDRNTSLSDLHLINSSRLSAVFFSPEYAEHGRVHNKP